MSIISLSSEITVLSLYSFCRDLSLATFMAMYTYYECHWKVCGLVTLSSGLGDVALWTYAVVVQHQLSMVLVSDDCVNTLNRDPSLISIN